VGGGLLCLAAAHFPLAAVWFRLSFDNRWDVLRRAGLQGDWGLVLLNFASAATS